MSDYVLKYSLEKHKPITIIYQKGLELSQREIQVLKIEKGLVHAFCYKKKAIRNFKKENILAANISSIVYKSNYDSNNHYSQ